MWQLLLVLLAIQTPAQAGELSRRRRFLLNVQPVTIINGTSLTELDTMMPMRDGVHLATDIYRFNDNASYPVLLLRTPYNKSEAGAAIKRVDPAAPGYPVKTIADGGAYWHMRGYIMITQDVRGRYNSEGAFSKYKNEANDGYDTVTWILNQPWCNGKIGMFGASYEAHTQTAALNANAGLTTIVPDIGGFSDSYQDGIRQGGAFEGKQCTWAYSQALEGEASNTTILNELLAVNLTDWFRADTMPWRHGFSPLSIVPDYENYVIDDWTNSTFSSYWTGPSIYSAGYWTTSPDVPFSTSSGWYDVYPRTATQNYVGLTGTTKKSPVRLLLGAWTHSTARGASAGNVTFGPNASYTTNYGVYYMTGLQYWYDRYLKNISTPADSLPPVRIFIMGNGSGLVDPSLGQVIHGGYWRDEKSWPLSDTTYTNFYFWPDGSLQTKAPSQSSNRTYVYSPWDPVPSLGGCITSGEPFMVGGAYQQATYYRMYPFPDKSVPSVRLRDRPDVIYFQTPVLNESIEVTGEIEVHLWISSNCTDTDFTAKIVDVYPDGTYNIGKPNWSMGNWTFFDMNIQDGILRTRYRNEQWSNPTLMQPGRIYPIVIKLFPTSNIFAVGHRLRVDISSSNFPKYDLNPNTGEPNGQSRNNTVAKNTVWLGGAYASFVRLPVINFPRPTCAQWDSSMTPAENEQSICGVNNGATSQTSKVFIFMTMLFSGIFGLSLNY